MVEQRTEAGPAEYGVVQRVDHAGRTAQVNWYQIYLFGSDARWVVCWRRSIVVLWFFPAGCHQLYLRAKLLVLACICESPMLFCNVIINSSDCL